MSNISGYTQKYVYDKQGNMIAVGVSGSSGASGTADISGISGIKTLSLDEILDRVEDGDVSVLAELGILYNEHDLANGNKLISFKYQGTKYTVNVIDDSEAKNGAEPVVSDNTKTVKNDDGSYTVYEYKEDANGVSLVKSTEYDKDGRVTHEFVQREDGSRSDKYYTYENGSLVQVQETIHYNNGNYTYIFTDANGNLKEEQKVIHNEQGGLTFDSTFGDGTRRVMVYNADVQLINSTFYSSDGKVERTEEYYYDSSNPNLYTVITKNAQGKILSQANWESYTFTDNEGNTWYGSRTLEEIKYDTFGNISSIARFNYSDYFSLPDIEFVTGSDEKFLDELKKLAEAYQQKLNDATEQFLSSGVPTPPSVADFLKPDGSTDVEAYAEAFAKYEEAKTEYDKKTQQYNDFVLQTAKALENINAQINNVTFSSNISVIEDKIAQLREAGNNQEANELQTKLNNLKKEYNLAQSQRKLLSKREKTLQDRLNRLSKPIPPKTKDYTTAEGNTDEKAYEEAFNNYDTQKNKYDRVFNKINTQLNTIFEKLAALDSKIKDLQANITDLM